jgi:hypothetical protein
MKNRVFIGFIAIVFIIIGIFAYAVDNSAEPAKKILRPVFTKTPPKLDGVLDDEAWQSGPILEEDFVTYNPNYGEVLPQKTKVYAAYDLHNLYFAFYCQDSEPDKIKATMAKRDSAFTDDWVGVVIDTIGNKQYGYEFILNPLGVQADLYLKNTGNDDVAPDWVWYSGGKLVEDGYIVEYHIPLKSIRYSNGKDVTMNVAFARRVSRTGMSGSWPKLEPSEGVFNQMTQIVYGELNSELKLEILPSFTYSALLDRETPDKWSDADDSADFGIGFTYGISSTMTVEATINPDFSQVESDEFQVIVNQRYPLFYEEKRPFFMEINNVFNLAGTGGDGNMYTAVHTRRIIDPDWGLKLQGELGSLNYSLLAAGDTWPGKAWDDGEENPDEGKNALFYIGRAKLAIGGENYIGGIFTARDFAGVSNKVIGGDFNFRAESHNVMGNLLYSTTNDGTDYDGVSLTLGYNYSDKPFDASLLYEYYDKDFRMDTAFYNRVGFSQIMGYIGPNFYPDPEKVSWLKKINPFIWGYYLHDTVTEQDDYFYLFALRAYFTRQGWIRLDYREFQEYWINQSFTGAYFLGQGEISPANWLTVGGSVRFGDSIYYDTEDPLAGKRRTYIVYADFQPNENLTQSFYYQRQEFDRADNGEHLYNVDIFRSRTTYQFNEYLFLRAVIQYDSSQDIVLTDLLASFTLIPGTVMHLGYGSLHNNLEWDKTNKEWLCGSELAEWYQVRQSFFFKVSYLFRF